MNTIKFPRNRPVTLLALIAFAFVGGVLVQRTEAQSTSEMRAIAAADYKKIDNELNVVYLQAHVPPLISRQLSELGLRFEMRKQSINAQIPKEAQCIQLITTML